LVILHLEILILTFIMT